MNSKYVAIAVTTDCNLKCPYCQSSGESIPKIYGTWNYNRLKEVIEVFCKAGYSNFRITGGEPTTIPYLGKLLEFLLQNPEVKVWVNTNGYQIEKLVTYLNSRTEVIFSVDGFKNDFSPKNLTNGLFAKLQYLQSNNIPVRLNGVVTKQNAIEVLELIQFCSVKGLDLKLLDLSPRIEYQGKSQENFFEDNYFDLKKLDIPFPKISSDFRTGMIKKEQVYLWADMIWEMDIGYK